MATTQCADKDPATNVCAAASCAAPSVSLRDIQACIAQLDRRITELTNEFERMTNEFERLTAFLNRRYGYQ